jgi:hypothetical protein
MSYFLETREPGYFSKFKGAKLNNSTLSQSIGSDYTFCSGSEISYIPDEGSDYVIYEYCFFADSYIRIDTRLVYSEDGGTTFTELSGNRSSFNSGETSLEFETTCNVRLLIDSWGSTERIFRIEGKGSGVVLHRAANFIRSSSAQTKYFIPTVACYSITES